MNSSLTHNPRVSIAMGVFNCASTLEEAVLSIKSQTFTDFELLICDDGSTDETLVLAERLSSKDSRIRILKNRKNLGLNFALNKCLWEAKGEFYARMDGDDRCDSRRLQKLVSALDKNPEMALVSSWMSTFDENGKHSEIITKPNPTKIDFVKGTPFCHAPCMMRTSVLKELGGYGTEPWLRRMQDYDLWFRLYEANHKGMNLQESLYEMRDDRKAANRRSFKGRLIEARIMWRGFRGLGLSLRYYPYILRPLIIGLLPMWLYLAVRKLYRGA